jgi:hypothetical protein
MPPPPHGTLLSSRWGVMAFGAEGMSRPRKETWRARRPQDPFIPLAPSMNLRIKPAIVARDVRTWRRWRLWRKSPTSQRETDFRGPHVIDSWREELKRVRTVTDEWSQQVSEKGGRTWGRDCPVVPPCRRLHQSRTTRAQGQMGRAERRLGGPKPEIRPMHHFFSFLFFFLFPFVCKFQI